MDKESVMAQLREIIHDENIEQGNQTAELIEHATFITPVDFEYVGGYQIDWLGFRFDRFYVPYGAIPVVQAAVLKVTRNLFTTTYRKAWVSIESARDLYKVLAHETPWDNDD